mmetsp:Transcript_32093/g.91006  ORF Transcript_32093/g.91006 Transcript_32093/m.91006 type:complete len:163 (+) Transcript_32093:340-828(+)
MSDAKDIQGRSLELLQRLDMHTSTMTENFINLVKAARINEEEGKRSQDKKVPGEMPEVLAEKIILGGKGLLELAAELKRQAIVSDHSSINKMKAERIAAFEKQLLDTEAELKDIKQEVADCLHELETHFYSSKHKPPLSLTTFKDTDLEPLYNIALELSSNE